jgi:hypothetical protein
MSTRKSREELRNLKEKSREHRKKREKKKKLFQTVDRQEKEGEKICQRSGGRKRK